MPKTDKTKTAETQSDSKPMNKIMDKMEQGYTRVSDSMCAARARNSRLMNAYFDTVAARRKDTVAMAKAVALAPTDYKANSQLFMDTMTKSQERALEFGKLVYREQSEASQAAVEQLKDSVSPFTAYTGMMTKSFEKFTSAWAPAK